MSLIWRDRVCGADAPLNPMGYALLSEADAKRLRSEYAKAF